MQEYLWLTLTAKRVTSRDSQFKLHREKCRSFPQVIDLTVMSHSLRVINCPTKPRGGGGTSILTVIGTCRWTGYDFAVITIDTGYLNWPNWLMADYSVYHRVASQPTMFMTGPRSRHQRRWVRDATDFYECMMIHSRIESPSVPVQGMHMKVFSKVYCDRVYFLCAERFETGSGFHYPSSPSPPPYPYQTLKPTNSSGSSYAGKFQNYTKVIAIAIPEQNAYFRVHMKEETLLDHLKNVSNPRQSVKQYLDHSHRTLSM